MVLLDGSYFHNQERNPCLSQYRKLIIFLLHQRSVFFCYEGSMPVIPLNCQLFEGTAGPLFIHVSSPAEHIVLGTQQISVSLNFPLKYSKTSVNLYFLSIGEAWGPLCFTESYVKKNSSFYLLFFYITTTLQTYTESPLLSTSSLECYTCYN